MGADGWIYLLDANVCDKNGYDPRDDFVNVYERTIFGNRIYTVYGDTEHNYTEADDDEHTIEDYKKIGAFIDEWEVWS